MNAINQYQIVRWRRIQGQWHKQLLEFASTKKEAIKSCSRLRKSLGPIYKKGTRSCDMDERFEVVRKYE